MTSEQRKLQENVKYLHQQPRQHTAKHSGPQLGAVTATISDLINNERNATRPWSTRGKVALAGTGGIISQLIEQESHQRTKNIPPEPSNENNVPTQTSYRMGKKAETRTTRIGDLKGVKQDTFKGLKLTPKERDLLAIISTMREEDITRDSVSKAMGLSTARVQDLKKSIFIKIGLATPTQER